MKRGRKPIASEEALRDLASRGLTTTQAASALQISYPATFAAARKYGISFKTAPSGRARTYLLTEEILRAYEARGVCQRDISQQMNIPATVVCRAAKQFGIKLPHGKTRIEADERAADMAAQYKAGRTLQQIGDQYGITRERARQIMTKWHGIRAKDGGARVLAKRAKALAKAKLDAQSLKRWGCTFDQYRVIRALKKPTRAFAMQRRNARDRGIGWELTLWQWWCLWQLSGKWDQRGRGQGYCMCRKGDEGPYSVSNVFIAPSRENSSEQKRKKSSLPIGVRRTPAGKFYACRSIGGVKHIRGPYLSAAQAYAAYLTIGERQAEAA